MAQPTPPAPEQPAPTKPKMDKRLRATLIATALLIAPGIGQFVALHDLATSGQLSAVAFLFELTSIFFIPTSLIVSAAVFMVARKNWRQNEKLIILCGINVLIALNLIWFIFYPCTWAQVFGLVLKACHQ